MKNKFNLIALFCLSFLFISNTAKEDNPILKIGKTAPLADQKMEDISGKSMSLNDLKQENGLLVVFSCNTCPFVVGGAGFPGWEKDYNDLYALCEKNKMGMVLINSNEAKRENEDSMDKMKDHAKEKSYKMPYVVDKNHVLADAFGAKTTPHIFLFDQNMKLIYTGSIDNSWDKKRTSDSHFLKEAFEAIEKGEKIKTKTSAPRGCSIKRV